MDKQTWLHIEDYAEIIIKKLKDEGNPYQRVIIDSQGVKLVRDERVTHYQNIEDRQCQAAKDIEETATEAEKLNLAMERLAKAYESSANDVLNAQRTGCCTQSINQNASLEEILDARINKIETQEILGKLKTEFEELDAKTQKSFKNRRLRS